MADVDTRHRQEAPATRHEPLRAQANPPVGERPEIATSPTNARAQAAIPPLEITRNAAATEEQTTASVDAIHKAVGIHVDSQPTPFGLTMPYDSFDGKKINGILENKSDAERAAINAQYKTQYGQDLDQVFREHLSGGNLERSLAILHRQDGNITSQRTDEVHAALKERGEWGGRSGSEIEKNIRDVMSISTAKDLQAMDQDYKNKYGVGMFDAIQNDPNLSKETKEAAKVLKNGSDQRTDEQTLRLATIGLDGKNIDIFREAMVNGSPAAREQFLKNGGEEQIKTQFSGNTQEQALDYARQGRLGTDTQISQNTGHVLPFNWGTNSDGIDLALKTMPEQERLKYMLGKNLMEGRNLDNAPADKQDEYKQFYNHLHDGLKGAGDNSQVKRWEEMIGNGGKEPPKDLLANLKDLKHWYGSPPMDNIKAIEGMSQGDQEAYRTNSNHFRDDIDAQVQKNLEGRSLDAAQKMLDQVKNGGQPKTDLVSGLYLNGLYEHDQGKAAHQIQQAFQNDPKMLERIQTPKTEEDRMFSQQFQAAANFAFSDQSSGHIPTTDTNPFLKELIQTGRLNVRDQNTLDNNDPVKVANNLANAAPDVKARLTSDRPEDAQFKQSVLGNFDPKVQDVLINAMNQGHLNPEDTLRLGALNQMPAGDTTQALTEIKPQNLQSYKDAYNQKYHGDLAADVKGVLTGQDLRQAERTFASDGSLEEQQRQSRNEAYDTRSGAGAYMMDNWFGSMTGPQADLTLDQMNKDYADYQKSAPSMSPDQQQQLQQQLTKGTDYFRNAIDNHYASKSEAAEYVADAAVVAAGIGVGIGTGGSAVPLITGLAAAGTFARIGGKALVMGQDYDTSAKNLLKDGTVGAAMGLGMAVGAPEVGAMLRVGAGIAGRAVESTIAHAATDTVLKGVIREGAETQLKSDVQSIMRKALVGNATELDANAIKEAADRAIMAGVPNREQAVAQLDQQLRAAMQAQTRNWLVNLAERQGLNAAAGGIATSSGTIVNGVLEGDSPDKIAGDAVKNGLVGMGTGVVVGGALEGAGRVGRAIRSRTETPIAQHEVPDLPPEQPKVETPKEEKGPTTAPGPVEVQTPGGQANQVPGNDAQQPPMQRQPVQQWQSRDQRGNGDQPPREQPPAIVGKPEPFPDKGLPIQEKFGSLEDAGPQWAPNTHRDIRQYDWMLDLPEGNFNQGKTIVDVGAGIEQNLAKEVNENHLNANVISIDPKLGLPLERDMLLNSDAPGETAVRDARLRGRHEPQPNTFAYFGDHMPGIPTNSADSVYSLFSISRYVHGASAIDANLREITRVLKPGGDARFYPVAGNEKALYDTILKLHGIKAEWSQHPSDVSGRTGDWLLVFHKPNS